ncbi:nucleoside triphosphate pyrophosphohydrolase [Kitasatospora phosalacinea]|uniref:Nucleoside triphosphate pyrophosphohydrolase n=1 Tax=Kitasatospora phosalacinea TaxID=2065 RepID=A0ABW6GRM2_9ACTN
MPPAERPEGKLVRDGVPEIIRASGAHPRFYAADGPEYLERLGAKLCEEAEEARTAPPGELLEELADVLEVLHALAAAHGADFARVEQLRRDKAAARGGFTDRIVWTGNE